jgi:hypothetical protein
LHAAGMVPRGMGVGVREVGGGRDVEPHTKTVARPNGEQRRSGLNRARSKRIVTHDS